MRSFQYRKEIHQFFSWLIPLAFFSQPPSLDPQAQDLAQKFYAFFFQVLMFDAVIVTAGPQAYKHPKIGPRTAFFMYYSLPLKQHIQEHSPLFLNPSPTLSEDLTHQIFHLVHTLLHIPEIEHPQTLQLFCQLWQIPLTTRHSSRASLAEAFFERPIKQDGAWYLEPSRPSSQRSSSSLIPPAP
jgi:hypothetical protein